MMWQCLINGVATFILHCKVHGVAAVSSAADGRRTMTNTL